MKVDSTIGSLPEAKALDNDSLLVAEQQGDAIHFRVELLLKFVAQGAETYAKSAKESAEAAAKSEKNIGEIAVQVNSAANTASQAATDAKKSANEAAELVASSGGSSGVYETASGESITLTDSADAPLKGLKLFGKTVQGPLIPPTKNLFDGELELGEINPDTGELYESEYAVRSVNFIPVMGGTSIIVSNNKNYSNLVYEYDEKQIFVGFAIDEVLLHEETRYIRIGSEGIMGDETDLSVQYTVTYAERTVDSPVYLENVGDNMGFGVYINEQSPFIDRVLCGIPVDTGGNYTDENGQKWCCDEIDVARGVYVQRVGNLVFDGTEGWRKEGTISTYLILSDAKSGFVALTSHFTFGKNSITWGNCFSFGKEFHIGDGAKGPNDIPTWIAEQHAAEKPVTIYYELSEPIETPLTAQELAAFEALRTAYLNTTITNDGNAGMEIVYAMDAKAYIDKRIAAMPSEIWTFTMEDGSTVDKEVVLK